MKADFSKQCFKNIKIQHTSLVGANFVKCNLSGSVFENVDISGINLNKVLLIGCKWNNLKINELHQLDGHNEEVYAICFSPDGNTLASGSGDNFICLWDVKTGLKKASIKGHSIGVISVCFSPDSNTLASCGAECIIFLWDV